MTAYAVQLTPQGMGAIAVILLAGESSKGVLQKILPDKHPLPTLHQSRRATLLDPSRNLLDDALLLCTSENRYELHAHGGTAIVDAILATLEHAGAKRLSLAEALTTNLLGPTLHAELLLTLSHATTLTAARLLAAQTSEGLAAWTTHWQTRLPTAHLWQLHSAAQWLLTRSHTLTKLLHPARVAIIGPPNAGKSTLANALLGRPVAITSDTPGTTRDWVDATATFTHHDIHVPIHLVDTAGIRETTDPLEQLSITRTHEQATAADLILLLFDACRPLPPEFPLIGIAPHRILRVANKTDLTPAPLNAIPISAKHHRGLDTLMSAVLQKLDLATINPHEPFAFTPRQHSLLHHLTTADLPTARSLLTALTK